MATNSIIDQLRGLYVQSDLLRTIASPFLSVLPIRIVYGKTYSEIRQLIQRAKLDAGFARQYQQSTLQSIINQCYVNSNYYHDLLKEVFGESFVPTDFNIEHLMKLPILDKETITANLDDMLVVDKKLMDDVVTSGSDTGEPFRCYLDKVRSVKEWAYITDIWSDIGYMPKSKRAVIRGFNLSNVDKKPWMYEPALRELRLSPYHLTPNIIDTYLSLIHKYKIEFIHGYPSAITIIASHAMRQSWTPPKCLKGVLPISEQVHPYQRKIIKTGLGDVQIKPFYGMTEKVAIAREVESGVYEFDPTYGYTEVVDANGDHVAVGQTGSIVSTGFLSRGMPLVRYNIGDTAEVVELPSLNNAYRLRVNRIAPRRTTEFLVSYDGGLISTSALTMHSDDVKHIREHQFVQNELGIVEVNLVPVSGANNEALISFVEELQQKIGCGVKLNCNIVEELQTNSRGKRRLIEQNVPIDAVH